MISPELFKQMLEGAEKYQQIVVNQAADLTDQTLKYFLFESVLSILQTCSILAVVYVVYRVFSFFCDQETSRVLDLKSQEPSTPWEKSAVAERIRSVEHDVMIWRGWRTIVSVIGLLVFLAVSVPHIRQIGKIILAPKLFILEKAAEVIKPNKKETTNDQH